MQGLIGKKMGMTQVYDEQGRSVPVTVIQAGACMVVQKNTRDRDGYDAVQLGFEDQKEHRVSKPRLAHFKKAGMGPKKHLKEFKMDAEEEVKEGDVVTAAIFEGISYVDITGVTKGRGFAGVMKRHRMSGGRMTHGGHSKRRPGSIGQCSYPARVAKGQRMPGHMGNVRRTQQNLRVVAVDLEDNILLVEGAVPGPTGAIVLVKKARKKAGKSE